jgi:preprotein translocase subunit Sec61beta
MITMAKEKMQAPQGMAGLVRYFDEDKSLIRLKPEHVVAMGVILVIVEIILAASVPLV